MQACDKMEMPNVLSVESVSTFACIIPYTTFYIKLLNFKVIKQPKATAELLFAV